MASTKPVSRPSTRPVARLDASLLLARKGEAMPAIAATQYNNPGLAWGAQPHPQDFQAHQPHHSHQPQAQIQAQIQTQSQVQNQAQSQIQAHQTAQPPARAKTMASARLRSDSFIAPRSAKPTGRPCPQSHADDVALTLRIEDETYLRLKYLAQKTGLSTRKILTEALTFHLVRKGVPRARKMILKPE